MLVLVLVLEAQATLAGGCLLEGLTSGESGEEWNTWLRMDGAPVSGRYECGSASFSPVGRLLHDSCALLGNT